MNERRCDNCRYYNAMRQNGERCRCEKFSMWVMWHGLCKGHEMEVGVERMTDREKIMELVAAALCNQSVEEVADHLLANGVTFATDTKVGDKWTPTDERLPENGVWVIAYQDCGWIGVAQIEEDGWHWYTQDLVKLSDPTHWMPLPEPPKEE